MGTTRGRILLLNTDEENQQRLIAELGDLDYSVAALNLAEQEEDDSGEKSFDLVLLDMRQPKEGDRQTYMTHLGTQRLKEVPVIVLAAVGDMEQVGYFVGEGAADDYLQEPFDATQLHLRVEGTIERKRLSDEQAKHLENADLLKIEQDVIIARRIQAGFLPKTLPQPEGWEISARFQPAREVAGDFYDAFPLSQKRRIGFLIADVVDKGVPAALFMALMRSLTRAFAQQHYSLSWMDELGGKKSRRQDKGKRRVRRIPSTGTIALKNAVLLTNNYVLDNHMELNMFATMFFGMFDPQNGQLAYINAGHNPPFIVGQDGSVRATLKSTGPAVGMFPGAEFEIDYEKLEPGDTLFTYTDGVTEARAPDKEFFGEERLLELLSKPMTSANEMVDSVAIALQGFIADATQFDDITMLAVHREQNGGDG